MTVEFLQEITQRWGNTTISEKRKESGEPIDEDEDVVEDMVWDSSWEWNRDLGFWGKLPWEVERKLSITRERLTVLLKFLSHMTNCDCYVWFKLGQVNCINPTQFTDHISIRRGIVKHALTSRLCLTSTISFSKIVVDTAVLFFPRRYSLGISFYWGTGWLLVGSRHYKRITFVWSSKAKG